MENTKYFNKEELEALKDAEKYFYTVVNLFYKSASPFTLNERVAEIYNHKMGVNTKYQYSCNSCMYQLFKKCGELYFKSKEYWQEEDKITEVDNTPIEPKKRGRKPNK